MDGQQQSCAFGLVTCKVVGPSGPSLTNRMSELLTYGSVGGVGGNPGPYPANIEDFGRTIGWDHGPQITNHERKEIGGVPKGVPSRTRRTAALETLS